MRLIDADALRDEWLYKAGKFEPNDVLDSIDYAPTIDPVKWIPVTERKPDDSYRVIVTDFGYVEVSRWFDGRWYDIDGNTLKGVTAWMPLPEPWRGEENDSD